MKDRICLPFVEGTRGINTGDIIYIESYRHRIVFHTLDGDLTIYKPLQEICALLDDKAFVRIHKSYIAGLKHVRSLKNYTITFEDGTVLPVPRGRFPYARKVLAG